MNTTLQDVRYALRSMRGAPVVHLMAVLSLAIGIGANTTVFSALDVFLIRPLPFPDADRLVHVSSTNQERGWTAISSALLDYRDWKERSRTLELAAYRATNVNLTGETSPERLDGQAVAPDFFRIMGTSMIAGRSFGEGDDAPGAAPVALVSEALWHRLYGGATDAVGRTVQLNGRAHTLIGVVPASMTFPNNRTDVWLPLKVVPDEARTLRYLRVVGRLRPGVTLDAATRELDAIAAGLADLHPATNAGMGVRAVPLRDELFNDGFRTAAAISTMAVLFVLLIACANVANLLLARAAAREREIALRTVLGAGRARVVRQLLTESVVLALIGGALGTLFAVWGIRGLLTIIPAGLPLADRIGLDGRTLAFTTLMCVAAGLLFGLAPTLHSLRPDLGSVLRDAGGRGTTLGRRGGRFRSAMVVGEMSLALVLLVCAGLLFKGYNRLRAADLGFDTEGIVTLRLTLPEAAYPDSVSRLRFYERLHGTLAGHAAIRYSGTSGLPLMGGSAGYYSIVGEPPVPDDRRPTSQNRIVLPDYFETMGIALVRGRGITDEDRSAAIPVLVVNQRFERRHWPAGSAIGQRVQLSSSQHEIVGVVADTHEWGASQEPPAMMYLSALQVPAPSMTLVARGPSDELARGWIRTVVGSIDPTLPLYGVSTMRQNVRNAQQPTAILSGMLAIFAGIAVLMAVLGVYGVMSYTVAQRTQEVGIRMALGAESKQVIALLVRQGATLAAFGILGGLVLALIAARFLAAFLFGVSPFDAVTFGGVAAALGAAAVVACWLPARRATRIDPLTALRTD
jgi:putative ABC transport system permease protein